MGGGGRRPRFGGADAEELDLSNLMSLYNAVKEDEKDRDEAIQALDVSYIFLDKCIELMEVKPTIAHRFIKLPKLISVVMFIAKCQHSYDDKVVDTFINLIREFYDRPLWTPLLKEYYLDFVNETIKRIDQDSINRGEFLQIFKAIGKKAGGIYTELGRDLKSYARGKMIENNQFGQSESDDDDQVADDDDDDEDSELGELVG